MAVTAGETRNEPIRIDPVQQAQLQRLLRELPAVGARAAIRKGSRAGSKIVAAAVKADTPVRPAHVKAKHPRGLLKKSVKTRAAKRSRKFIGAVTVVGDKADAKTKVFSGVTYYGAFVELGHHMGAASSGWRRRRKKERKKGIGMKRDPTRKWIEGQHFMEKAGKRVGRRALRIGAGVMRQEIAAEARKLGRVV